MTLVPDAGVRVLFVDGDRTVAETVGRQLEGAFDGVALRRAPGADGAIDRLDRTEVDCVACFHGRGIDCLALLRAVREREPDLPFVLYADEGDETPASDALAAGVTDYVPIARDGDGCRHLTARIRDAIERRRSEVSYREVFEKSNVGLTVRDVETGELLDANERYCELLGYSLVELRSLDLGDITADVPGYTHERARDELRAAIEDGPRTFEWPDLTADGDVLWVEVGLNVARIEGRRRILGTIRDVTERRERRAALRESEERFRSLFEHSVDAIYLHDADGVVLEANQKACEHHGYDRDELVGMHVWDISEDATPDVLRRMCTEMSADEVWTATVTHRRADGSTYPAEVSVGKIDVDGDEQFVALARDVTDRVARERELERKNEHLEEFASVVSHDLRNPLNVVTGRVDLARETGETAHLEGVDEAVDRMERLIDDLLALARRGETIGEREPVSLDRVAEESWERVATGDATLDVAAERRIVADEERLAQVFENFYRNAVEHGSTSPDSQARQDAAGTSSGEPSVADAPEDAVEHDSTSSQTASRSDDAVEHGGEAPAVRVGTLPDGFYVEDDGPGIPEDERDRVTEWGHSPEGSSGVGLSVVAEIVDAHGWALDVTTGEGGGARFEITGVEWR